ncbi:MAG: leucyl/phenylalanyl-tRNA--protein transferase [Caulobacterales bacterium]|nr:leucyl/phenylalanyl-tRNA--protein transferase [Caulobacterales bacterium]
MADSRADPRIFLLDPDERGVLPLNAFHVPRRLARSVRADTFQIRVDSAFDAVVDACAAPAPGRPDTWINDRIVQLYRDLHRRGQAHSVEAWREGELVGGLYGVRLAGAFFGESMFSLARDASKVALAHLAARLVKGGFTLLDAQFITSHLRQFGATEISREAYHERLAEALQTEADFYRLSPSASGAAVMELLQRSGQTS